MNEINQSPGRLRSAACGAVLAVLAGLLLLSHSLGSGLAHLSFDLPFQWRPSQPVEGIIIIYADEDSARDLGQKWGEATWDRTNHARLLNRLQDCRAKAVVFDIVFDRPSPNDQVLINAIQSARQAGIPVVLGGEVNDKALPGGSVLSRPFRPTPELEKVSDWGLAEWPVGNAPIRRHFVPADGVPSLAMRTAELTLPHPRVAIPEERWINFYGPPVSLQYCWFSQALDTKQTAPEKFAGKVCFVGLWPGTPLAGGVRSDLCSTPYSRWGGPQTPGVELTATVYLNLARRDWLARLPAWLEACIMLLTGLLFGSGFAIVRPSVASGAGLGAALAVAAAASWGMWHSHVWFSWLNVASVQIPVGVVWSALAYNRRLTRDKALSAGQLTRQPAPPATVMNGGPTVVATHAPGARPADRLPTIPDHTMLRCVGRGAYGEVWLARNAIGAYHAVKIVRREAFEHAAPFEREFRGLQKFMPVSRSHPGLVQVLHVGRREPEGFIYYVMEAADDENTGSQINPESYSPRNLAKVIRQRGHLPVAECLQLGVALTAALEFLHQQQLIHRDIKPANIIFVKGAPKFADIGLVTNVVPEGGNVTYVGTKGYIAPEGPGTPAADVYSLGKVLYEASMGLNCESFPELPPSLVQRADHDELIRLNKVILKACRQDPRQRYRTAAEMHDDLRRSVA